MQFLHRLLQQASSKQTKRIRVSYLLFLAVLFLPYSLPLSRLQLGIPVASAQVVDDPPTNDDHALRLADPSHQLEHRQFNPGLLTKGKRRTIPSAMGNDHLTLSSVKNRFVKTPVNPSHRLNSSENHNFSALISQAGGSDQQSIDTLYSQIDLYKTQGEYQQAFDTYQQLLAILRSRGDHKQEAEVLSYIAGLYEDIDQHKQALNYYKQCLTSAEKADNNDTYYFFCLGRLADTHEKLGEYEQALEVYFELLAYYDGDEYIAYYIAKTYEKMGDYQQSLSYYQELLASIQQEGNSHIFEYNFGWTWAEPKLLEHIANVYDASGKIEDAHYYREQSRLFYEQKLEDLLIEYEGSRRDFEETIEPLLLELANNYQGFTLTEIRDEIFRGNIPESELGLLAQLQGELDGLETYYAGYDAGYFIFNIASAYEEAGQLEQAIDYYQKFIEMRNSYLDPAYGNLLVEYYDQPIVYGQDTSPVDQAYYAIARLYEELGEYDQALNTYTEIINESYELDLSIYAESSSEFNADGYNDDYNDALDKIGWLYYKSAQYEQALGFYDELLANQKKFSIRGDAVNTLRFIGHIYRDSGQYQQALNAYGQSLTLSQGIGDLAGEGYTRSAMGSTYLNQGQYQEALSLYEEGLKIHQDIGNRIGEGESFHNLGLLYAHLGAYEKALDYYQQSLTVKSQMEVDPHVTLNNIGTVYKLQENYDQALDYYQQSLPLSRAAGSRTSVAYILDNMGTVYRSLEQYEQALSAYEQGLEAGQSVGDRPIIARTINNIGVIYSQQDRPEDAMSQFQQALAIRQEIGDRFGEAESLKWIGYQFQRQGQPELAIVFYKNAINVQESIRQNIQVLPLDIQQAYTDVVADDYRALADLLLEQGRISEAQQVLDLLKLEELREFAHTTRATWTGTELQYNEPEQAIIQAYGSLIAFASKVDACEETRCDQLNALLSEQEEIQRLYQDQINQFTDTIRDNAADDDRFQDPNNLSGEAEALLKAYAANGQKAILIYPFVLEDKLWVVWAVPGLVNSFEYSISQGDLAAKVQRFGELLNDPYAGTLTELQTISQELHSFIIDPLEAELAQNDIEHLVFVNDRVTRYIPMAALFDGEQYLIEKYTVSSVLTPGLTDTEDSLTTSADPSVLGLGLTDAVGEFAALPAVAEELDAIIRSDANDAKGIYPGQMLLNEDFTLDALKENVLDHRVLHIASHAVFKPGRAEESYIALGTGEHLKPSDIKVMHRRLNNLHLVVLSACETALGGTAGDGTEIAGISSYFLDTGRAEAVIASLWLVSDGGTSLLMQELYKNLAQDSVTKAEALRQAQLTLLKGEVDTDLVEAYRARGLLAWDDAAQDGETTVALQGLSHPYYWAPFILIGNGL